MEFSIVFTAPRHSVFRLYAKLSSYRITKGAGEAISLACYWQWGAECVIGGLIVSFPGRVPSCSRRSRRRPRRPGLGRPAMAGCRLPALAAGRSLAPGRPAAALAPRHFPAGHADGREPGRVRPRPDDLVHRHSGQRSPGDDAGRREPARLRQRRHAAVAVGYGRLAGDSSSLTCAGAATWSSRPAARRSGRAGPACRRDRRTTACSPAPRSPRRTAATSSPCKPTATWSRPRRAAPYGPPTLPAAGMTPGCRPTATSSSRPARGPRRGSREPAATPAVRTRPAQQRNLVIFSASLGKLWSRHRASRSYSAPGRGGRPVGRGPVRLPVCQPARLHRRGCLRRRQVVLLPRPVHVLARLPAQSAERIRVQQLLRRPGPVGQRGQLGPAGTPPRNRGEHHSRARQHRLVFIRACRVRRAGQLSDIGRHLGNELRQRNGFRVQAITPSSGYWPTSFIHVHDR